MNYDSLTSNYWQEQIARVEALRKTIKSRDDWVSVGRVVPGDEDLVFGTGRRLEMAVLFLDLCKFSGRPSETYGEQEQMLRALNLFFTEMLKIAEDYGGVVEKNTGDGLMAYFNDGEGTPPEGGCKRAVSCALTMMRATEGLINPILRASNIPDFTFRIGIDYGTVTIAQLGAAKRFGSLVAIGTTANVASKILGVAGDGEIIIGENVFKKLPQEWQLKWCGLKTVDSGWTYRNSQNPYRFYCYKGRWKHNA